MKLLASEASETLLGVAQLKIRYLFICTYLDGCMLFLYFDPGVFALVWLVDPVPNFPNPLPNTNTNRFSQE